MKSAMISAGLLLAALSVAAGVDDAEYDFYGFRVSAGYQMGINLKSSLNMRVSSASASKKAAYERASGKDGAYYSDDGGFIIKDGSAGADATTSWQSTKAYPSAANPQHTKIALDNAYRRRVSEDDEAVAHGAHVDLSATVGRDGDWGLDVFVGFSWMRGVDCFDVNGTAKGSGYYRTEGDIDASLDQLHDFGYPDAQGFYRGGAMTCVGISEPIDVPNGDDKISYHAKGDYDEYDVYGGFRLWYADEEYKWFKVTSTFGLGADYGDFEYQMSAQGPDGVTLNKRYGHGDWDVYGLLGLGLLVDIWNFDLALDALWRFAQDPLKVNTPYVNGEIERPDFIFRASLGYNF